MTIFSLYSKNVGKIYNLAEEENGGSRSPIRRDSFLLDEKILEFPICF